MLLTSKQALAIAIWPLLSWLKLEDALRNVPQGIFLPKWERFHNRGAFFALCYKTKWETVFHAHRPITLIYVRSASKALSWTPQGTVWSHAPQALTPKSHMILLWRSIKFSALHVELIAQLVHLEFALYASTDLFIRKEIVSWPVLMDYIWTRPETFALNAQLTVSNAHQDRHALSVSVELTLHWQVDLALLNASLHQPPAEQFSVTQHVQNVLERPKIHVSPVRTHRIWSKTISV